MKKTLTTTGCAAIGLILANTAGAVVLFDADFTAGQGYADGEVNGQPGFTETQGGYPVSDSAGSGLLSNTSGSFVRAQFGGNALDSQTAVVGSTILTEAANLTVTADPSNQTLVFGLSGGGGGGAAQLSLGGQITTDGTNLYVENRAFAVDAGGRVDTGFDIGQTFNYSILMTAESAGSIETASWQIEHQVNGATLLTENAQTSSAYVGGTSTTLGGFIQDQGGATFSTSQLTVTTTGLVPEPSVAILGGLGLLGLLRRRR